MKSLVFWVALLLATLVSAADRKLDIKIYGDDGTTVTHEGTVMGPYSKVRP